MVNLCCDEITDKKSEHLLIDAEINDEKNNKSRRKSHSGLFTVLEVYGDDTGQSYLRNSADNHSRN